MPSYVIYDTSAGDIVGFSEGEAAPVLPEGYKSLKGAPVDPQLYQVLNGAVVKRVAPLSAPAPSPAEQLATMLATIDDERETQMMAQLTSGGAKKLEYAAKLREWQDFNTLTLSSVLALTPAAQQVRWPWAMAEAADSGDTLQVVMARYKAGMDNSALARKVAARAQTLKRKLKAASPADRASIFNSRMWPTS